MTQKLAKAMHPRVAVNGICLMTQSLAQQAESWQRLGAQRVSFVGLQIEKEGLDSARNALASGDYQVETVVHTYMVGQHLNPDPGSWQGPRDRLLAQIDATSELGARSIYMTTGGRGDMSWEQAADVFAEAIAPCVDRAKAVGLPLLVENAPPAYADIHIAHTLRDTITLAERAGIGVCMDIFSCWTEAGLRGLIEKAAPRLHLVQVSDYVYGDRALPARAVPGDGDIPLKDILRWLIDAGYRNGFDLELLGPRIDNEGAEAAVARAGAWVGEQLIHIGSD
ncbi:sugar phosphate isomerase/epimerase [Spongiibacter nanhainus]|uniref:Sugar phosphate isomerase/epimerase n=1 Tax=Spongiibacter nanhainus TaxID=2794344 RepID=A0A7T4R305_9GAMM|nr:sugar phosphate isomerase/epimerase family protein [Spongiibacter nanhainus]QQD19539.1 sugar phosphate isomerase/epimerase [Spongiibacter nanhainus]